jgi:hypothetical protein
MLTYSKGLAVLRSKAHACLLSIASSVEWPTYIDKVCVSLLCRQAVNPMTGVQHRQVKHIPILCVPHMTVLSNSHLQRSRDVQQGYMYSGTIMLLTDVTD